MIIRGAFGSSYNGAQSVPKMILFLDSTSVAWYEVLLSSLGARLHIVYFFSFFFLSINISGLEANVDHLSV